MRACYSVWRLRAAVQVVINKLVVVRGDPDIDFSDYRAASGGVPVVAPVQGDEDAGNGGVVRTQGYRDAVCGKRAGSFDVVPAQETVIGVKDQDAESITNISGSADVDNIVDDGELVDGLRCSSGCVTYLDARIAVHVIERIACYGKVVSAQRIQRNSTRLRA